jgi:lipopolysaccharide transport system permease protein
MLRDRILRKSTGALTWIPEPDSMRAPIVITRMSENATLQILPPSRTETHQRLLDLIRYKTYADLKFEAKRTYIGFLWWIIEPVLFMVIFYFVFAVVFQRGEANFVPFLLIGLTTFHWVQSNVIQSCGAISGNRGLIQQVYVPKFVFPTVLLVTTTIKFGIVYALLLVYLIFYGFDLTWHWLLSGLILGNLLLLIAGLSYLTAAITPLLPDVRILIDNAFRATFFLSGIFYDIRALDPGIARWLQYNPFAVVISDLRGALMYAQSPHWRAQFVISLMGTALIFIGLYIMRRNELRYAKTLL